MFYADACTRKLRHLYIDSDKMPASYFLLHLTMSEEEMMQILKELAKELNIDLCIYDGKTNETEFVSCGEKRTRSILLIKSFVVDEDGSITGKKVRPGDLSTLIANQKNNHPSITSVFVLASTWLETTKYVETPHIYDYYKILDFQQ